MHALHPLSLDALSRYQRRLIRRVVLRAALHGHLSWQHALPLLNATEVEGDGPAQHWGRGKVERGQGV